MSTLTKYGKQIRMARREKNLTQEQLADKLFVSKQAVSNWERGVNAIDDEIRRKLEKILSIRLIDSDYRKEITDMEIRPLDQIEDVRELMGYARTIVGKTPVDMAFSSTVKKLLELTLDLVLGYEVYARSFERAQLKREHGDDPFMSYELTWEDVSEDLFSIFDNEDPYPLSDEKRYSLDDLYMQKIRYMLHSVGIELFEDFDEEGHRDGYIQKVGRIAEEDAYALLSLLPERENSVMTSYKASLHQMAEIIEGIAVSERRKKHGESDQDNEEN